MDHAPRPPPWPPNPPAVVRDVAPAGGTKKQKAADISDAERALGKLADVYVICTGITGKANAGDNS